MPAGVVAGGHSIHEKPSNMTISTHTVSGNPSVIGDMPSRHDYSSANFVLTLQVDDQTVPISHDTVRDPDQLVALRRRCLDSGVVVADLTTLFTWNTSDRHTILQFLVDLDREHGDVRYRCRAEGNDHDDLLDAIFSLCDQNLSRTQREIVIYAAVEAATYCSRDALQLEVACAAIAEKLREAGFPSPRVTTLVKRARSLLPEVERTAPSLRRVRDVLRNAPCPDGAVIPPLWILTDDGIASASAEDVVLVPAPVVITRRLAHVDGGEESVELAWLRTAVWQKKIVPRGVVATARTIVNLAGFGLPVTSSNASALVDYMLDFEVANLETLPESLVSNRMGWIGEDGEEGFLCGNRLLSTETGELSQRDQRVAFLGADVGDQQLVEGLHAQGTFEGWRDAIAPLARFPRARLAIYASLIPPLLMPLASPNFVLSYAGATSQGKTTVLRAAASVWGLPDERSPAAVIGTWDATAVSLERTMAARDCIPMITDDTKRARRPEDIAQIVYAATSGRGRGRGTTRGLAGSGAWRTNLITCGESPLTSFTEDGGTRARVLETWGSPFGGRTAETAVLVVQINDAIQEHYGHAGPRFVEYLIAAHNQWPTLRENYRRLREWYQQRAGNNSVAGRMAAHFAVLHLVEELACQSEVVPWTNQQTAASLWNEFTSETDEADRAAAALRFVVGWSHAHESEFWTGNSSRLNAPTAGWAGRWRVTARQGASECLAIHPHRLDQILEERGFEPAAIRRLWKDRGWLRHSTNKTTLKVRIDNDTIEMVAMSWDSIREITGGDAEAA